MADALAQPFPDAQFDLVWSMESGEHMPDKEKVYGSNKFSCSISLFFSRLSEAFSMCTLSHVLPICYNLFFCEMASLSMS